MNVLSSFQAPHAFLNVTIIEAKNLTPTDPNGMLCIYMRVNYFKCSEDLGDSKTAYISIKQRVTKSI